MNGSERSIKLGEGNEESWEKLSIYPLDNNWRVRVNDLVDIIVGGYNLSSHEIKRVIGGCCIYKSQGKIELLPFSFLLELLNIFIFSSKMNVKGLVLLPIAEECHNYPVLKNDYEKLGKTIEIIISSLSDSLDVSVSCNISKKINGGIIKRQNLYGLFHPFTKDPVKAVYPLGDIAEDKIIKGYESYSLRYRYVNSSRVSNNCLIVDGLHLAKSVIIGLDKQGQYIVTSPFPSLLPTENCLLVDSHYNPSILDLDYELLGKLEYFDEILKKELNKSLLEIIKITQEIIKNHCFGEF